VIHELKSGTQVQEFGQEAGRLPVALAFGEKGQPLISLNNDKGLRTWYALPREPDQAH